MMSAVRILVVGAVLHHEATLNSSDADLILITLLYAKASRSMRVEVISC